MDSYDIIVVGGGPAGMSCALNILRGGKTVLLLEKENFGGQIATSPRVENIAGIKDISGQEFTDKLYDQLDALGFVFELEDVQKITKKSNGFIVKTDYNEYECKAVVLATGCKHRHIGVAREEELIGKGVSYCAVCDGAFYKGEEVALIGDANSALQYALALSNYCTKVHICALFDHLFADKILCDRVKEKENIDIRYNIELQEFIGKDELSGLRFRDKNTGEPVIYNVRAVFIAIGQIPDNDRYAELVDLDHGYIVTDELMQTKTPGIFAIGDCRSKKYRQVATATGDGLVGALSACNYVETH